MVRVAVAGVDVLIVVLPRLRRPELEEERDGKVPGHRALTGNQFALLNSSGRVSVPGRLVVVPLPLLLLLLVLVSCSGPDDVLRVWLQTEEKKSHTSLNYTFTSARVEVKCEAAEIFQS